MSRLLKYLTGKNVVFFRATLVRKIKTFLKIRRLFPGVVARKLELYENHHSQQVSPELHPLDTGQTCLGQSIDFFRSQFWVKFSKEFEKTEKQSGKAESCQQLSNSFQDPANLLATSRSRNIPVS